MKNKDEIICQVDGIKSSPEPFALPVRMWVALKHVLRQMKRLAETLRLRLAPPRSTSEVNFPAELVALNLKAGERVRVRSADEIRRTLDAHQKFQGTAFTREMWQYCGQEFEVFKPVRLFLNETNNRIQKISNTVLLTNVYCSGERAFGERCDRSCFLFWKEIWLERVERD